MTIDGAFDVYQASVNSNADQVRVAGACRDFVAATLTDDGDVLETIGCGALARGTWVGPVHHVGLIVVVDQALHPDWGGPGDRPHTAIEHLLTCASKTRGTLDGRHQMVAAPAVAPHGRSVECVVDALDTGMSVTVHITPAMRITSPDDLLTPSTHDGRWVETDPEFITNQLIARQEQWPHFIDMVRVLKKWCVDRPVEVDPYVVEILALQDLPAHGTRMEALRRFFDAASIDVIYGVDNPQGRGESIQDDLDVAAFAEELSRAAELASTACQADDSGDDVSAARHWRRVFGSDYPLTA